MLAYFNRFGLLGCVLVLTGLYGCATMSPAIQAQKALLSRASYEQIRPSIEKIQVGDEMSKVLEIARPKEDNGHFFKEENRLSSQVKYSVFPMWPGVLTPFWDIGEYIAMLDYGKGDAKSVSLPPRHLFFGYLDGAMLRPRKILIFENQKVSKIIDFPDFEELIKEPGVTIAKVDLLDHLRRQAYEKSFLPKKDRITLGMEFWEVFTLLNASYIMTSDAQSYVIMCPGYLNYKRSVKAEKTPEGVRAIYPFGYVEGDTEIVKWEVEMLNYRVVGVRAHKE
jgi:hypothetical protein